MTSTGEDQGVASASLLDAQRWRPDGDLRAAFGRVAVFGVWVMAVALVVLWAAAADFNVSIWIGYDSHAYWVASHIAHPYGKPPGTEDAFLYSPAFAQAMRLLAWMPWPVFFLVFATVNSGVFLWLTSPLRWQWRAPILLICATEVVTGNIAAFLALSLVIGCQRGGALAFPALTKILPGGLGLVWHMTRGDWRQVARAAFATLLVAGLSFAVTPNLWFEWASFLLSHRQSGPGDLAVRVLLALGLVVYAGRSSRPTILAVALWLALPMDGIGQIQPYTVLVAAVRLHRVRPRNCAEVPTSSARPAG